MNVFLNHLKHQKGLILAIFSCLMIFCVSGCKNSYNGNSQSGIKVVPPTTSHVNTISETTDEKKEKDLEKISINNFKPIKESFIMYDFDEKINGTKEEPLSFTVQGEYDLNQDGSLDTINIFLRSCLGREKNVQTYIQVNDIKKEIYMDYTLDGEVRIIDLDPNDKFLEIAYFDEGPSGDPHYNFYRYDGNELYNIGGLDSSTLFNGEGKLLPGSVVSKFEPKFYSAWYEIEDNQFVKRINNIGSYMGKTYKFNGGEAYFIPTKEMPNNFEPRWEEQRQFEASEIKVIDVYFYPEDRNLNFYFVEFPNGGKGMLYFWMGD